MPRPKFEVLRSERETRAELLRKGGMIHGIVDLTLSEALVLGLLKQGVSVFYTVFGHGSTEIGEVLRIYHEAGLVRVYGLRNEIEASHAAAALRWITGEKAAVVTSIGPGALQALAASIMPASDGIGVWYLFGDETSEDEGFNMQQIPLHEQGGFLKMMSTMGRAYSLHTPLSLPTALQIGALTVDHPYRPGPFYLLMPMNTQATWLEGFNLEELPEPVTVRPSAAAGDYNSAVQAIKSAKRVLVKAGGGAISAGDEVAQLLELSGGVLVHTPIATGCIPYSNPANLGVGGSKGSLPGNFAMENADLLIAVGTRAVCQSDCSRTGYPRVQKVININANPEDALHYHHTLPLVGDVISTLKILNQAVAQANITIDEGWRSLCADQKSAWKEFKEERRRHPTLLDAYWGRKVLTQPAAIMTALDWAKSNDVVNLFDAGDVQANGFQLAEDERPGMTFTEGGASYMGFAVCALLATNTSSKPFYGLAFTGDGSFTMNPQILIDGIEHGARGCILLLDNGRMGAISGLQNDQYQRDFATSSRLKVDYRAWAGSIPGVKTFDGGSSPTELVASLNAARQYEGLSFIHVPVYFGIDPLGGMGVYGRWNVGNWCDDVQALRHEIGL